MCKVYDSLFLHRGKRSVEAILEGDLVLFGDRTGRFSTCTEGGHKKTQGLFHTTKTHHVMSFDT